MALTEDGVKDLIAAWNAEFGQRVSLKRWSYWQQRLLDAGVAEETLPGIWQGYIRRVSTLRGAGRPCLNTLVGYAETHLRRLDLEKTEAQREQDRERQLAQLEAEARARGPAFFERAREKIGMRPKAGGTGDAG